jgi:hypothetical protein
VDAGLNAAYWALLSATKNSVPWLPGGRSLFMDTVDTSKHALITLSTLPSSTTANIVLTSTGVKGASWDVLLHTSVSNLSTLTVANLTAYDTYTMYMQNFQPDTDGVFLRIRLSPDNGSTFVSTTVYSDVQKIIGIDGNTYNEVDNSAASFFIGNSSTNPINGPGASRPNFGVAGKITFYNLAATTSAKIMSGEGMYQGTAAAAGFNVQGLANASSGINVTSVNALQFLFSAGNISTGVLDVYGIKNG